MASIVYNGTRILDANIADSLDDNRAYAEVKPQGALLSVKVGSDAGTILNAALIDQAGAKALLKVLFDEGSDLFPSWGVTLSGV